MTGPGIYTLAPLAFLAGAAICYRHPAATTIAAFTLSGTYGSLKAFTGLSGAFFIDLLLMGLWGAVLYTRLIRGRSRPLSIWPSFIAVALYLALTVLAVLTADDISRAFLSFRLSGWYLLAAILIAYAGWQRPTYTTIARGFVVVGLLVGAYATFRWFVGPADKELARALEVAGPYNYVDGKLRTFGSFNAGHQLGYWAAAVAPFCLAAALAWKRRWRLVAGLAFLLLVFAVLASEVRGGFIGLVLGTGAVLGLAQVSRSMPSVNLGRTAIVTATCVTIVAGALLFTAGASNRLDRYTNIFHRDEDISYVNRQLKWTEAIEDIEQHPFGQGIGSGSLNQDIRGPFLSIAYYALDNSFLKIAFEQGFVVMVLFVVAMVLVLLQLTMGALRAIRAEAAAMALGATGALISSLAVFYTGMEIEDVIALGPWLIVGLGAAFLINEQSEALEPERPGENNVRPSRSERPNFRDPRRRREDPHDPAASNRQKIGAPR